ncbi:hypothetical protein PUNSTDRAFT_118417 [Punctularia strigosozonata HHB-11173 SS5]|uniref:uncharacterized protein n=1 Tax=Punctularia strigosozonata (strain HHB-11173) TaxID=741275 RepID=UPI0004416591|nr:uncharacterized protein PUNSTDRAFT_118417 [Punctularia strigosozonata HHB-11173 SS5]EIN12687.1 hypothetical protein PUNSTDRAFT_118417 [Punctularia strigosozonata HHB-11173 SS5]
MFRAASFVTLAVVALSAASVCASVNTRLTTLEHAFELIVYRDPAASSGACGTVQLREFGTYKGLSSIPGGVHIENLTSEPPRIRAYSHDADALWTEARKLCGDPSEWDFPVLVDSHTSTAARFDAQQQTVFTSPKLAIGAELQYPPLEVHKIVQSGPSTNRVDLMFFSDGYLASEKQKFLDDATKLALEISANQTFDTVQPLLNFWAAFSPSNEHGIGTFGKPKDTPFGLYRPGTELRGVLYSKPDQARAACLSQSSRCDYPILLGNDPLYGGLGGQFTVITPSEANGALILRHELGHSVIPVGEEYDGGYAYFGVNANHDRDLKHGPSWSHWLTDPPSASRPVRVERSVMPLQDYAWAMLNTSTPWSATFTSSGTYSRYLVRFSISGVPSAEELTVLFDGRDLNWEPKENIGVDRYHYDVYNDTSLKAGEHIVTFILNSKEREKANTAQLCNVEILEFGDESEFVSKPGYYGVFPTFSDKNETSYRPTNEDCLMRQVTTPDFCSVCTEGLWLALARRVEFVDDITTSCTKYSNKWKRTIELNLVPLAQFRVGEAGKKHAVENAEKYEVKWTKDGKHVAEWDGLTKVEVGDDGGAAIGTYSVEVAFSTHEVRKDVEEFLKTTGEFAVSERCG